MITGSNSQWQIYHDKLVMIVFEYKVVWKLELQVVENNITQIIGPKNLYLLWATKIRPELEDLLAFGHKNWCRVLLLCLLSFSLHQFLDWELVINIPWEGLSRKNVNHCALAGNCSMCCYQRILRMVLPYFPGFLHCDSNPCGSQTHNIWDLCSNRCTNRPL